MTAEDINIGIGALLETLEMAYVVFYHTVKTPTLTVYQASSLSCTSVLLHTYHISNHMDTIQMPLLQNVLRV
jgi:hypothetical protein